MPLSQADTLPVSLLHTGCTQEETHFSVLLLYAQQRRILLNNSFENWQLLSFRVYFVCRLVWVGRSLCRLLLYFEPPQLQSAQ